MRRGSRGHRVAGASLVAVRLLAASPAAAAPSASEKAAAEALFQEGTELMQKQSYPEACAKFEASNAIESGLGVKLWLADCYDRAGRTASAWALFTEASALAQKSGQEERERMAHERAGDLEKRLSKLELVTPAQGLPANYSVELDGVEIPSASVGSALPVDPGDHVIVVRAPGFEPHTLRETVPPGPTSMRLDLPPLTALPAEPQKPAPAATDDRHGSAPGHTQRLLAYSLGGLGVLSLAGGGFFAYRAHQLDKESLSYCLVDEPNACNEHGASLRDQAQTYGNAATAAIVAGGALVTTGVVLLVTAPRKHEIRVGGTLTPGGAFVSLGGKL